MSLTTTRDGVAALMKALHALTDRVVLVGIPSTATERKEKGEAADNAMLGYIHEFGAPAANIPARPFLVPGVEAAAMQVTTRLRAAAEAAIVGDTARVNQQMTGAGMAAASSVKNRINDGIKPDLSPRTLAARKAKGYKGTTPLVRTAQLRNSITYVIRKK